MVNVDETPEPLVSIGETEVNVPLPLAEPEMSALRMAPTGVEK